jgi:hypothetical protein
MVSEARGLPAAFVQVQPSVPLRLSCRACLTGTRNARETMAVDTKLQTFGPDGALLVGDPAVLFVVAGDETAWLLPPVHPVTSAATVVNAAAIAAAECRTPALFLPCSPTFASSRPNDSVA